MITVGQYISGGDPDEQPLNVLCDAPELEAHVGRPWFAAHAAQRLGTRLSQTSESSGLRPLRSGSSLGKNAAVEESLLSRHTVLCGATGSGKTRLALHLLTEQIKAGCSVVMLDPKAETIRHLLHLAYAAGVSPAEVTLLSPHAAGAGAPGWNPLDAKGNGLSPVRAAADMVTVLEKSTTSWGPRLQDLLTNALLLIAAHNLSLFELARFFQSEEYRAGLLRETDLLLGKGGVAPADRFSLLEARDYFTQEFGAWGKAERASAVGPVLNKFRELLRSPFLRTLLCARRNTLDLSSLWQRRGLVLVHLDSEALGGEGARLLGGLLAHQLQRLSARASGPVPVVLALDEMGIAQSFLGGAVTEILALARSRNLRLLVACQHLAQLSDELRTSLLANTAMRAFFRLGPEDARLVAASLSVGTGERITSLAVDVAGRDKAGNPEGVAEVSHPIRDGFGQELRLTVAAGTALAETSRSLDGAGQVFALRKLARLSGIENLYVLSADWQEPVELFRYLAGVSPRAYRLTGRAPVRLVIRFPKPKLTVLARRTEGERAQRWARVLMELPVRQAVLRLATGEKGIVRVVAVEDGGGAPGFERFVAEAIAQSGQSGKEAEAVLEWRRAQVEWVAGAQKALPESKGAKSKAVAARLLKDLPEPVSDEAQLEPHNIAAAGTAGVDGSLI